MSTTPISVENIDPSQSVVDFVTVIIIIAPLVKTALFQALPAPLFNKLDFFKKRVWLTILVNSIKVVSPLHFYSIPYVLFCLFLGFFSYDWISFKAREALICYHFYDPFDDQCYSSCVRANISPSL